MFRPLALLLAVSLLSACAQRAATPVADASSVTLMPADPWREAISTEDGARIDALMGIWVDTIGTLPRRAARSLAAYDPLLDADAALDHPTLTPGSYSCRVVRLGSGAGAARLRAFPDNFCYVTGETEGELTFTKQTGTDLPAGRLYPDGDRRYVFVGAKQVRAGENSISYGVEGERDAVGVVERIGSFHWRLVVPKPDGRGLDVYELTPTPEEQQPD